MYVLGLSFLEKKNPVLGYLCQLGSAHSFCGFNFAAQRKTLFRQRKESSILPQAHTAFLVLILTSLTAFARLLLARI